VVDDGRETTQKRDDFMVKKRWIIATLFILFVTAGGLLSCGGSGSNPTDTTGGGSNKWDEMKWDQGKWG